MGLIRRESIGVAGEAEKPGREGGIWGLMGWAQLEQKGRGQGSRGRIRCEIKLQPATNQRRDSKGRATTRGTAN